MIKALLWDENRYPGTSGGLPVSNSKYGGKSSICQ
jgi:hypothetical protein